MRSRNQLTIFYLVVILIFASSAFFTNCATTPPAPTIDPTGQIKGITLPADCGPVQLKITMSQDATLTPGGTGAHSEGGGKVSSGTLEMPDVSGFDLTKAIKIDVEVVVGNCAPFIRPSAWHFEGILNSLGGSKYSVDFSKFLKTR